MQPLLFKDIEPEKLYIHCGESNKSTKFEGGLENG